LIIFLILFVKLFPNKFIFFKAIHLGRQTNIFKHQVMENSKYSLPIKHKACSTSPLSLNDSEVTVNPKRIKLSHSEDSLDFSDAASPSSSTSICSQNSIENQVIPPIVNPHLNDQAQQNLFYSYRQASSNYGYTSEMYSRNFSYDKVNGPPLTFQFNKTPAYYFENQYIHNAQLLPNYQHLNPY
jgi:hypothetical protein